MYFGCSLRSSKSSARAAALWASIIIISLIYTHKKHFYEVFPPSCSAVQSFTSDVIGQNQVMSPVVCLCVVPPGGPSDDRMMPESNSDVVHNEINNQYHNPSQANWITNPSYSTGS